LKLEFDENRLDHSTLMRYLGDFRVESPLSALLDRIKCQSGEENGAEREFVAGGRSGGSTSR
jgi:hypothetical protein